MRIYLSNMIEAVDLFCGAGGLTAGLLKANIIVKAGYDINNNCKYAYEFNNNVKFLNNDIAKTSHTEITKWYSKNSIRLLAGCAPCQPFSAYNHGKDNTKDKRWPLLYEFSRLIENLAPELVTMENVPYVTKHQVYHDFTKKLEDLNYHVWAGTVNCPDYGIPQYRKRHVLLASKLGEISLLEPTHKDRWLTVRDTISNLPIINCGEESKVDKLHKSALLSDINLKRIRASKQGGTWRDWPEELQLECHKKVSGKGYVSVYGRMNWDEPSPTITTQSYGYGNGRFGHPEQDRALSLREAALLQTFPENYSFFNSTELKIGVIGKMIGNAVPVRLGEIIGQSFIKHVDKYS